MSPNHHSSLTLRTLALVAMLAGAMLPWAAGAARDARQPATEPDPLAALAPLVGSWRGEGSGFSTRLTYAWQIDGHVLGATNEVRDQGGAVVARYQGSYAWDAGQKAIVFWTASASGEAHRDRAWWADGVLWHEAEVSGGRITAYASAVRPAPERLSYYAAYGTARAMPTLLESEPIVYTRIDPAAR